MGIDTKLKMDLKTLRTEAGYSVGKVAKLSGIPDSVISRIEVGESPSLGTALRLARFLQVPIEEIWGLDE